MSETRAPCIPRWYLEISPNMATSQAVIVDAVVDDSLSLTSPLGDAIDVFSSAARTRSGLSRKSRATMPRRAAPLRIEERGVELLN